METNFPRKHRDITNDGSCEVVKSLSNKILTRARASLEISKVTNRTNKATLIEVAERQRRRKLAWPNERLHDAALLLSSNSRSF